MEAGGDHESLARDFIDMYSPVWTDRLSRFKPSATDRTVRYWIEKYRDSSPIPTTISSDLA
jgi:hypothetical protein